MPSACDSSAMAPSMPPARSSHSITRRARGSLRQRELEREVAGQRDDGRQRAAVGAVGLRRGREQHLDPDVSSICFCCVSSSTWKRAATSASNGNCCRSRVQKAWMVCTFNPPGVSSASANSLRARASRLRVDALDAGLADFLVERVVVERGPAREPLEHAVRHVGRGRLGVGEAEDFRRIGAVEQQADHALRQHVGLAGAGVGRHPRRRRGIGRLVLRRAVTALGMLRGAFIPRPLRPRLRRRSATIPSRARGDRSRRRRGA